MRPMETMVNIIQVIISDIGHTVQIRFTVFSNFSKLLFVLRIFGWFEISTPAMRMMLTNANIV